MKSESRSEKVELRRQAPAPIKENPEVLLKAVSHLLLYTEANVCENVAKLPQRTAQAVLGLFLFARENKLSNASLAPLVVIDKSVIGRLFNGTYVIQNYKEITDKILGFLEKKKFALPEIKVEKLESSNMSSLPWQDVSSGGKAFPIPGDTVRISCARLELSERQRDALIWFHHFCYERDLPGSMIEKLVGCDFTELHQAFFGRKAPSAELVEKLFAVKTHVEQKQATHPNPFKRSLFIETNLTERIFRIGLKTRDTGKITFIYSDSQIGKSHALKWLASRHPATIIYVEMPTSGNLGEFKIALAEALGIGSKRSSQSLDQGIRKALRPFQDVPSDILVIVDEVHEIFSNNNPKRKAARVKTLDYIRKTLFNHCGVGLILCGTYELREQMKTGKTHAQLLKQTFRRSILEIELPALPTKKDLNMIAAHFGLPAASGYHLTLQNKTVEKNGLGKWITLLNSTVQTNGNIISWADVDKEDVAFLQLTKAEEQEAA